MTSKADGMLREMMWWGSCVMVLTLLMGLLLRGGRWARQVVGRPVGQELLWHSIIGNDLAGLKQAIAEGADVNRPHPQQLVMPLESAAAQPDARFVEELLKHGAVANKGSYQFRPLLAAVMFGRVDSARLLISAGAPVDQPQARWVLVMAIRTRNLEMVSMLLWAGADVTAVDVTGASPLQAASETDNDAIFNLVRRRAPLASARR